MPLGSLRPARRPTGNNREMPMAPGPARRKRWRLRRNRRSVAAYNRWNVLTVWVREALPDQPIRGRFLVEPSGSMSLGAAYGRVRVAGLSREDAETAIRNRLQEILREPDVEVLFAGRRAVAWTDAEVALPDRRRRRAQN